MVKLYVRSGGIVLISTALVMFYHLYRTRPGSQAELHKLRRQRGPLPAPISRSSFGI
jgi:hypothetical protein